MLVCYLLYLFFFFSSRRRHTRLQGDWSSDVCSSDLFFAGIMLGKLVRVGDWVRLAGQVGRVVKVDLGHVTILTPTDDLVMIPNNLVAQRSEERRVGKECRSRWSPYH